MNKIKLTIILTLFAVLCTAAYGQVTVGSSQPPVNGALLDIKEFDPDDPNDPKPDNTTAKKGLLMPRVNLSKKDQLYPMFLKNPDNQSSGPNDDYSGTKKSDQDKKHIGLVVYNVDDTNGLDLGVHSWDGEQWVAVKSGGGSGTTYSGEYPIVVENGNIYLATKKMDGSTPLATGSILRFDGADWVVVVPVDNDTQYTGSASIAVDASTNVISVKDNGVTTDKIKDANVTPEKIEGGEADYVLTATGTNTAPVWAPLKSSGGNTIIVGPGDTSPVLPAGTVVTLVCNACAGVTLTSIGTTDANGDPATTGAFSYLVYSSSGTNAFAAAFSKFNKGDSVNDSAWSTNSVTMPSLGGGQYGFVWMLSAGQLIPGNGMYLFGN